MRPYFCPIIESCGSLAREECSLNVHRHREIVILNRDALGGITWCDACVVHKDVEAAKVRDSIMHCALNLIEVGHIHLQRDSTATQRPDFVEQPRIRMDVPQPQCHVRPGMGERQRDRPTKAAGRSCDEGYLIRKGKTGKRIHPHH